MTLSEFSNAFDTLLASYNAQANFGEGASKQEIVLDEYEKSMFLTQAQDIIVKSYFNKELNPQGQGFDDSSRRQIDFSSLITIASPEVQEGETFDDRGVLYKLPSNILLMLNERVKCDGRDFVVVPINYSEFDRLMTKAYGQPLKKQVWRLFQNISGIDITSELIPVEGKTLSSYKVRYIRRPQPIVLVNLALDYQEPLEIDGVSDISDCELNPIVHMDVLTKAVELAIVSRGGGPNRFTASK